MKTTFGIKAILKMLILVLVILTGSVSANAQRGERGRDRDEDRGRGREYREDRRFYKENREHRDRYEPAYGHGRTYIQRAPWGIHRPYVMSHNRGRLYFYRGHYYEYYPRYGYAIVEAPVGYEFDEVPPGFSRVWVDNAWCYRRGDFYLRPSVHGYISFNRPGISIGAGF